MKILKLLPYFILFIGSTIFSQETSNTIENQFTEVIDKSNRYQDYKVVKIVKLNKLKKSISDSIGLLKNNIETLQKEQFTLQSKIDSLSSDLEKLNQDLNISKEKENGIVFFGTIIKKSVYNSIMWGMIVFLLVGLFIFIFKFKRSNSITREAKEKLADTEAEFDKHRQNTLEREQQLRRKLQDEMNKQRKA